MDDLIGKTLGQYQIVEEIGRGGMAIVYKAYQPALTRHVAIKVLPRQLSFDQNFVERFVREARGAAALHHANIVTIHDVSEQDGVHYFVMEYLAGQTLGEILGNKPMPLPRIARILDQVSDALDHAHSHNLIHRDIKPSNIIVDEKRNDHVVLMDFGLVRAGQDSQLTKSGMIVGTPEYMSPEQVQGEEIDHRTDVYSLGIVLYRMLTGSAPFERTTPAAVLLAHVASEPPSVSQINRGVPLSVEAVVLKAMAKKRDQRYEFAGQLARDLRVAITGQMPAGLKAPARRPAPVANAAAAPVRVSRRSPLRWVGLGALALVVLFGALLVGAVVGPRLFSAGGEAAASQEMSPSPSPTLLAAPKLEGPPDGAGFSSEDTIRLSWGAIPGLAVGDVYEVAVDCGSHGGSPHTALVTGTTYTVPKSLYSSLDAPQQCHWHAMAMSQTGLARSRPSDTRRFVWSQAIDTPTPTLTPTPTPTATTTHTRTPTRRPIVPTNTPMPTPECSGGRIWNGAECVCPPDKPEWLKGVCLPKGGGGGDQTATATREAATP
jgi:tRNA A-37 threonylcarbamoyl transferase component Bud32